MHTGSQTSGKKRGGGWGVALLGLLLMVLCGGAVRANLWKRDLLVESVKTSGNRIVATADILKLGGVQKRSKLFDVNLADVQRRVKTHPYLSAVSINRNAPGGITINVVEREPIAALGTERLLFLDPEGVLLPSLRADQAFDVPVVTGVMPNGEWISGHRVSAECLLDALRLLSTAKSISDDLYRRISEVHIMENREMLLYTAEMGVPVVFGRGDEVTKLMKFDGFWRDVVSRRGTQDLQYIDVRFEDQVVVRWNTGTQAVKN